MTSPAGSKWAVLAGRNELPTHVFAKLAVPGMLLGHCLHTPPIAVIVTCLNGGSYLT